MGSRGIVNSPGAHPAGVCVVLSPIPSNFALLLQPGPGTALLPAVKEPSRALKTFSLVYPKGFLLHFPLTFSQKLFSAGRNQSCLATDRHGALQPCQLPQTSPNWCLVTRQPVPGGSVWQATRSILHPQGTGLIGCPAALQPPAFIAFARNRAALRCQPPCQTPRKPGKRFRN